MVYLIVKNNKNETLIGVSKCHFQIGDFHLGNANKEENIIKYILSYIENELDAKTVKQWCYSRGYLKVTNILLDRCN